MRGSIFISAIICNAFFLINYFYNSGSIGPNDVILSLSLFLNAAAVGSTEVPPRDLLHALLSIEAERGRERPHPGAARTLDLDLVLYGNLVLNEPELAVPHPRFRERRFVLEPLAEIAPDLVDPVTGSTVGELLRRLAR